jgi:putative redox protein
MKITCESSTKFKMEHQGNIVISDQPVPRGNGEGMTPVALMSAALGSCIGIYVADYLTRNQLSTEGMDIDVEWKIADRPKRVSAYQVKVNIPHQLTERQHSSLSRIVKACTVHNTMHHAPEMDISLLTP